MLLDERAEAVVILSDEAVEGARRVVVIARLSMSAAKASGSMLRSRLKRTCVEGKRGGR